MVEHIYPKSTPHPEIEHYDVLILGGGPAGLTAALYAGRYNLSTALIAKSIGGTAVLAGEIENWPGFSGSGSELIQKFKEHSEKFGARFLESEIQGVIRDNNGFVLEVDGKVIHGRTLILALGAEHKRLHIPGEKEFTGKGVSYCTTCDGIFFKNKTVAVIGGANAAAKSAEFLSDIAKEVYIIVRKNEMGCEPIIFKQLKEKNNITIYYNSEATKIEGTNTVRTLYISQENGKKKNIKLHLDGIFIAIGATPVNDIIKSLKISLNQKEQIVTDKAAKTNVPGVFAAGDGTDNHLKQVVTAAAEGAIAAKSAYDYLKLKKSKPLK